MEENEVLRENPSKWYFVYVIPYIDRLNFEYGPVW
jgi:hypothetical protein